MNFLNFKIKLLMAVVCLLSFLPVQSQATSINDVKNTPVILEKAEEVYARQARMKAEIRRKLAETGKFFGPSRLLRAFPGMRHRDYSEVLKELLESLR